jgi:hypothetical protein
MEMLDKFKFEDHIGGIASNGVDRLYLANWDTVHLYVCDMKGKVIEHSLIQNWHKKWVMSANIKTLTMMLKMTCL